MQSGRLQGTNELFLNSAGLLGQVFLSWLEWSITLVGFINEFKITELQSRS